MKKFIFLLSLILSISNLYSKNKTIVQKTFYETGIVKEEISLKNGIKNGVSKYFFDDGSLKSKHNYVDDQLNGKVVNYYKNGKVEQESNFVMGVPSGIVIDYFSNGTTKNIGYLEDGKFNGAVRGFYKTGSKYYELFYQSGKRLNYINVFDKKGKLLKSGTLKIFTTDGVLYVEYPFENHRIVGTVKYYDEHGNIESEFTYVDPDSKIYIYDQVYLNDFEINLFANKTWKSKDAIDFKTESTFDIDTNDMNIIKLDKNGNWDFVKFEK